MFRRWLATVKSQEGVSLKDVHPLGGYEKLQPEMAATEEGFRMTELCLQVKLQHPGCIGIIQHNSTRNSETQIYKHHIPKRR